MSDEPAAKLETKPLTLLIQQVDTFQAEGRIELWRWRQATEAQRAQYVSGLRANCVPVIEQRFPGCLYQFLPMEIDDLAGTNGSLLLGKDGTLHRNAVPAIQRARVFRAMVVQPSAEARETFLSWAKYTLGPIHLPGDGDDEVTVQAKVLAKQLLDVLADMWASGSQPPKAPVPQPAEGPVM